MAAAVKIERMGYIAVALRALAARRQDAARSRQSVSTAMVPDGSGCKDAACQAGMDRQTLHN